MSIDLFQVSESQKLCPSMAYDLDQMRELGLPKYAEKVYLETRPLLVHVKNEDLCYEVFNSIHTKMYGRSNIEILGRTELEVKAALPRYILKNFYTEDAYVFKHNQKYIAFGSFNYADKRRHVCYAKEIFFDPQQNKNLLLVTEIEIPEYLMGFLVWNNSQGLDDSLIRSLKQHSGDYQGLYFSNINLKAHQQNLGLSKREEDYLFFMLRGQSAKEIAKTLNISIRTAEFHADNLKSKFGVNKKSELCKAAINLGYLNFVPESLVNQTLGYSLLK